MMDSAGISGGTPARARFKGAFQHPPRLDVPVECDPFAGPIGPAAHADFHAVGPPAPETEIDGDVDAVVLSVLPADISLEHRWNGWMLPLASRFRKSLRCRMVEKTAANRKPPRVTRITAAAIAGLSLKYAEALPAMDKSDSATP